MRKRYVWPALGQVAVVLGYLAVYTLVRPLSDAHWELTAGLRMGLLLVVPYRYWAALAIGDTATNAYQSYLFAPQFGLAWSAANALPLIACAMPVVWLCKEKLGLFPSRRLVNFQALLLCMLAVSAIWSLVNYAAIVVANNPGVEVSPILLAYLFVGAYVALLTIVPWVVIAKLDYRAGSLKARLWKFAQGPLVIEAAGLLIPAQLILYWLALHGREDKQIYCLFMFMPVAWLTLKHGWRAAVLGGTIVVACICLLVNYDTPDPIVLQVQAIIAFAISCLMAMGARISAMHQREQQDRIDLKQALRLARQSLHVGEARLRQASETLRYVCGEMEFAQNRLLNRFRTIAPANESQLYSEQMAATQEKIYQIADAMHPIAWLRKDLPTALRETIGRALREAGIVYSYQIKGRGFGAHSSNLHTMIYRLACESAVYIYAHMRCSSIQLTLRGAQVKGDYLVVLRIEGGLGPAFDNHAFFNDDQQDRLAKKLGATRLDLAELRDHARLSNGELHVRIKGNRLRLTFLLHDISDVERKHLSSSAPLRLWAG